MLALKTALYTLTIGFAFFFASWELKLRRRLTDDALDQQNENVSDYADVSYGIRREVRRERIKKSLPAEILFKLRIVASLKFLFVAILIAEVIFLQR
jgi:hypothetical protein